VFKRRIFLQNRLQPADLDVVTDDKGGRQGKAYLPQQRLPQAEAAGDLG
jgi:hypothetical protein